MKQRTISGGLPHDVAARLSAGTATIRISTELEKDEDFMSVVTVAEEVGTLRKLIRENKLHVVIKEEGEDMTVEFLTKKAGAGRSREEILARAEIMFAHFAQALPMDTSAEAQTCREKLLSATCASCKLSGYVDEYLRAVVKKAAAEGHVIDVQLMESLLTPQETAKLRRILHPVTAGIARDRSVALPPNNGGPRPTCLDCCRKHIGKAIVKLNESYVGDDYRNHFWLAMGELAEAEEESVAQYPGFSALIRETRLEMMENREYRPDLVQFFDMIDDLERGLDGDVEME